MMATAKTSSRAAPLRRRVTSSRPVLVVAVGSAQDVEWNERSRGVGTNDVLVCGLWQEAH